MKLLTIAVISMMIMLSSNSSFADAHAESIEQTLKAVSEGYAEVVKRGFAWTTTKPLIDQAKEAIAKGNSDEAKILLKSASLQVKAALAQSERPVENLLNNQ